MKKMKLILKDLLGHLMTIDLGVVYKIITDPSYPVIKELEGAKIQYNKDRAQFGFIPFIASCSEGQLGALNSESYAERTISCANLTVDTGNTGLNHADVERLIVLRMNRDFMECMRVNYSEAIMRSQPWNMTLVSPRSVS